MFRRALPILVAITASVDAHPSGQGWSYLEAGSTELRAAIDDTWGGLAVLGRGQLNDLALAASTRSAFAVTRAALHDAIDEARPMRTLVHTREWAREWAMLFAARPGVHTLPTVCRIDVGTREYVAHDTPVAGQACAVCSYVTSGSDRAVMCGSGEPATALRDEFVAHGLQVTPGHVHAEQGAVTLELDADASSMHATISLPATTGSTHVSASALAAATRIQALSSRVEVGPIGAAFDLDASTPLQFAPFSIEVDTYSVSVSGENLAFVEEPIASVVARQTAYWRASHARITPTSAKGLPTGSRRFRVRESETTSGDIAICPPGKCRVVGHEPKQTFVNERDELLIPTDGGTWVAVAGDPHTVTALLQIIASSVAVPTLWTLPAVSLGRYATPKADVWWAEHATTATFDGHAH